MSVLRVGIIDDGVREGDEEFTLELTSFDVPVVLVNSVLHVVVKDNDNGIVTSVVPDRGKRSLCMVRFSFNKGSPELNKDARMEL